MERPIISFDYAIKDILRDKAVKSEFTAAGIQAAGEKLNVLKMTPE